MCQRTQHLHLRFFAQRRNTLSPPGPKTLAEAGLGKLEGKRLLRTDASEVCHQQ